MDLTGIKQALPRRSLLGEMAIFLLGPRTLHQTMLVTFPKHLDGGVLAGVHGQSSLSRETYRLTH
jgi:hypothetical protein